MEPYVNGCERDLLETGGGGEGEGWGGGGGRGERSEPGRTDLADEIQS